MSGISVVVPVGPEQHHRRYLEECLLSVSRQTRLPNEVLLVDDMAGMPAGLDHSNGYPTRTWRAPWRLGVAAAFNCGVALAEQELVLMLGADDWLEPECLEACLEAYKKQGEDPLGYYYLSVRYHAEADSSIPQGLDDGVQTVPCNAAMVTKKLWDSTGGFPPEASTAPDAAFVSVLLVHEKAGKLIPVEEGKPLYNYRVWGGTDTRKHSLWTDSFVRTRHLITQYWEPPAWGRYSP